MSDTPTKLGMAPNLAGLVCYVPCCIGFVFSIVAAVVEKENRFIRFHAFQSLLLHAVIIVLSIGLTIAQIAAMMMAGPLGTLVFLIRIPFGLALLGLMILMMIKANNNEEFKLPIIGDMAAKWL
jgi:uncharacterized membrane protein